MTMSGQNRNEILVTNKQFLQSIFRDKWPFAHVTAFPDDPSAILPARRGICWSGGQFQQLEPALSGVLNSYFCVSIFSLADGRAVRRKDNFLAMYCLVADDVGDRIPRFLIERLPEPSWILETSPGNEQWGWILEEPETNRTRAENISEGLIRMGLAPDGKDPGMRGVTRYVRLPEGWNLKAKYGAPFKCRMLKWSPEKMTTLDALAEPFGVDLDAPTNEYNQADRTTWPEDAPVMQWLAEGNLIEQKGEGKFLIRCPRVEEHSGGDDSGTVLYTNEDGGGGFECHHSHGEGKGFNDFLDWAGIKEKHDVWRAFRQVSGQPGPGTTQGLPSSQGQERAAIPAPGHGAQEHGGQPVGMGSGPIDFMGAGGGAGFPPGGDGENGSDGSGPDDGEPERRAPITGTQPWDGPLAALPVDPSQDMDAVRRIIESIARLPDLERGRAGQALKDRCRGFIPAGAIEGEIRAAMARFRAERLDGRQGDEVLLSDIVFLENDNKYYRLSDGAIMAPMALDSTYGHLEFWGEAGPNGEPIRLRASQAFDRRPDKLVAQGLGWKPSSDTMIRLGHRTLVNTYKPPALRPVPGDVTAWLWLGEQLCGPEYWPYVLAWFAWIIQHPDKKIRWQILMIGVPRIGKTSVVYPLLLILAEAARSVSNEDIDSGWGDIWYQIKLLVVEEVLKSGHREFYNSLKSKMVNSGLETLNIKGRATVLQENLVQMFMFSNHWDALNFDENDEKLFVIEARTPIEDLLEREAWFNAYYNWLDEGDGAANIYHYLLHYDLTGFQYGRLPVKTPAYYKASKSGKPDYQRYLQELIDEEQGPFGSPVIETSVLKAAMQAAGYTRGGDRGIAHVMQENGFVSVRGQKRQGGKILKTPRFWTRDPVSGGNPKEIYEWYMQNSVGGI